MGILMNEMENRKRQRVVCLIFAVLFLLFFGGLWAVFPPGMFPDSESYLNMQAGREPVYPLFLYLMKRILGEGVFLKGVTLIQNLLAACSCLFLGEVTGRKFKLSGIYRILTFCATLIPYLLTPLASASHMLLGNAILTEGITFPLFTFFTGCMVEGLLSERRKEMWYGGALLLGLLLSLTRNQMLICIAVWIVVILFEKIRGCDFRRFFAAILFLIIIMGIRQGAGKLYNSVMFPGFGGADTGSYNLLTTLLYLSDEEDSDVFQDKTEKELFLAMHEQMQEQSMTHASAPAGVLNRAYHYEDFYDVIGFSVQQPVLFSYAAEEGAEGGERLKIVLGISSDMCKQLMPDLLPAYIINYLLTAMNGMVRSIAASGTVMGIYSLILYFLAGILVIYLYTKNRQSKAALLMLFALLMICANAFATALMIMCLSRYMIYNTALFYIAGLMEIKEVLEQFQKKKGTMKNGL